MVQAGQTLMGVVDVAVVGRVGAAEVGAVGLGNSLFFFVAMFATGIAMGIDPLISQAVGAANPVRARRLLWQGIYLSIAVGLALSIPLSLSPAILPLFDIDPAVARLATVYLEIRLFSLVPLLSFIVVRSYLQAKGITRPMVISMVIANVLNLIFDIALVHGGGVLPAWTGPLREVPAMGVSGAAVATVASSLVQLVLIALPVPSLALPAGAAKFHLFLRDDFVRALRVGIPVGCQLGAEVGVFALVGLLAGNLGELPLAAHQVALVLASFTFTMSVGVGSAGSVRVGHAVGALDEVRTRIAGLTSFGAGVVIMSAAAALFILFPRRVISLISDEPAVIAATVPVLLVAAFFQISDGVQAVGSGVLRGAGDTKFAFVANFVGHWVVGLPIALLLGFKYNAGVVGLWWGLLAGLTTVAVLLFVRFLLISSRPIVPLHQDG